PRSATSFTNWIPAVGTGAAFFMIVLDTSIVILALARIGTELNSGLATLQWLVDGYALVFASFLLGAGALGDRFGAKGTFMCGLVVFTLASALCGMAPTIEALQVSRIVQGIGAALLLPNSCLGERRRARCGPRPRPRWSSPTGARLAKHLHRQCSGRANRSVAH